MFTANDFSKELKKIAVSKSEIVDTWLKEEVLPEFTHNEQGFICPKGVSVSECAELLAERGFYAKTYSQTEGSYIYITIPPQGE